MPARSPSTTASSRRSTSGARPTRSRSTVRGPSRPGASHALRQRLRRAEGCRPASHASGIRYVCRLRESQPILVFFASTDPADFVMIFTKGTDVVRRSRQAPSVIPGALDASWRARCARNSPRCGSSGPSRPIPPGRPPKPSPARRRGGGGLRLLSWLLWLIPLGLLAAAGHLRLQAIRPDALPARGDARPGPADDLGRGREAPERHRVPQVALAGDDRHQDTRAGSSECMSTRG